MEMLYGNEVNRLYVKAFRKVYAEERRALAALKTKKAAQEYVKSVREKVRSCFHFPKTKCPLVRVPATWWPYSALVPDVLRHFDLPDLRKAIAAKLI